MTVRLILILVLYIVTGTGGFGQYLELSEREILAKVRNIEIDAICILKECGAEFITRGSKKTLYIKYSAKAALITDPEEESTWSTKVLMKLWMHCMLVTSNPGIDKIRYRLILQDGYLFICGLFEIDIRDFRKLHSKKDHFKRALPDLKGVRKIVKITRTALSDEEILAKVNALEQTELNRRPNESEVKIMKIGIGKRLFIKHSSVIPALGTKLQTLDSYYESFYPMLILYCSLANGGDDYDSVEYRLKVMTAQGYICRTFVIKVLDFKLQALSFKNFLNENKPGFPFPHWRKMLKIIKITDIPLGSY